MTETRSWKRTLPREPVRYYGAYKWGGYWHTLRDKYRNPRMFKTPEAARKAAAKAAPNLTWSTAV